MKYIHTYVQIPHVNSYRVHMRTHTCLQFAWVKLPKDKPYFSLDESLGL